MDVSALDFSSSKTLLADQGTNGEWPAVRNILLYEGYAVSNNSQNYLLPSLKYVISCPSINLLNPSL